MYPDTPRSTMALVYINGKFLPLYKAKISLFDRGFLYGDGAFETMRAYRGTIFLFERHIERLQRALSVLDIDQRDVTLIKMHRLLQRLLKENGLSGANRNAGDAYVKLIVTRGESRTFLIPAKAVRPTIAAYTLPKPKLPQSFYTQGVTATTRDVLFRENSAITGLKTLNYLPSVISRKKAIAKALWINSPKCKKKENPAALWTFIMDGELASKGIGMPNKRAGPG